MPISREKKEQIVQDLHKKTENADIVIFVNFSGLSVAKMSQIRKTLRKIGAGFKIAKKRLIKRVMDGFGFAGDAPDLEGEVGIMFKSGEPIESVKALHSFVKNKGFEGLNILGGVFEKKYVVSDTVKALAAIPSRDILLGRLVGSMASPLRGLAGVLGGPMRNMVGVLHNLSNKK